jgi:hypothetical protein
VLPQLTAAGLPFCILTKYLMLVLHTTQTGDSISKSIYFSTKDLTQLRQESMMEAPRKENRRHHKQDPETSIFASDPTSSSNESF